MLLLTSLTMVAFAANSLLNRAALIDGATGPAAFAVVRVLSGAVALVVFARISGQPIRLRSWKRVWSTLALVLYVFGFSIAYVVLDAGLGALILFGGVQLTMFAGALIAGNRPSARRWIGMAVGLGGLVLLLWPSGPIVVVWQGTAMMMAAALGWGIYSLLGRGSTTPLADTAGSFLCAVPFVLAFWLASGEGLVISSHAILLAIVSGVLTSGLGYALWYTVLPQLDATVAGLAQLTVPLIAVVGGVLLLSESVGPRTVIAGLIVLGGVAFGIAAPSGRSVPADRR